MESEFYMRDIFYCYSARVKEFLCDNGYPFILMDYHKVTHRKYWGFARGKVLDELLEKYKEN